MTEREINPELLIKTATIAEAYGIDPARVQAEGMGYLAPIASNLSPAGREANRRVEAILLSGS